MKQWCLRWNSLKLRLVEANKNPCSEIRDLFCCRLIYMRENIITYPELVKHIMNICLLLLMDVSESCLSCIWLLSADVVWHTRLLQRRNLFIEEQINSQHLFEQLGQILGKSWIEGGAAWAASGGRAWCREWGHRVTTATDPPVVVRSVPCWLWVLFLYNTWDFHPWLPPLQCNITAVCGSWGVWVRLGPCLLQLQFCLLLFFPPLEITPAHRISHSSVVLNPERFSVPSFLFHRVHMLTSLGTYPFFVFEACGRCYHVSHVIGDFENLRCLPPAPPTAVFQSCLCFQGRSKGCVLGLVKSKEASLSPLLLGRYSLLESASVSLRKEQKESDVYLFVARIWGFCSHRRSSCCFW